jgi:transcriptional regulator with XRE-family HTH domain
MIKKKKQITSVELPGFQESIDAMSDESRIFVDKSLEIAHFIHYLMEKNGLKQKDLADRMEKSEAEVSKILSGMQNLTLRTIAKLEAALGSDIIRPAKLWYSLKQSAPHIAHAEMLEESEEKMNVGVDYNECPVVKMKGHQKLKKESLAS